MPYRRSAFVSLSVNSKMISFRRIDGSRSSLGAEEYAKATFACAVCDTLDYVGKAIGGCKVEVLLTFSL